MSVLRSVAEAKVITSVLRSVVSVQGDGVSIVVRVEGNVESIYITLELWIK